MRCRIFIGFMAIAACLWTSMAFAFSHNFNSYEYTFGQDVFTVLPGGTVEVPIYFQETVGLQDRSVLALDGAGIVGAGVQVLAGDLPQPSQPARVRDVADIIPNPCFDIPTPSLSLAGAKLALAQLEGPVVHGEEYSLGVYRLLLGTFRFTAGDLPGEDTPIRATDFDPGFRDFVTGDLRELDILPIPDAAATIRVVPEPRSWCLLVAAGSAGLAWPNVWRKLAAITRKSDLGM